MAAATILGLLQITTLILGQVQVPAQAQELTLSQLAPAAQGLTPDHLAAAQAPELTQNHPVAVQVQGLTLNLRVRLQEAVTLGHLAAAAVLIRVQVPALAADLPALAQDLVLAQVHQEEEGNKC